MPNSISHRCAFCLTPSRLQGLVTQAMVLCGLLVLLHTPPTYGQQWISKQYAYDSIPNLVYGNVMDYAGQNVDLTMDIYQPVCTDSSVAQTWPLLIFVHGGAFLAGSKNDPSIQDLCKQFAKRGYVTASISYRLGFVSDDVAWNCNYPQYNCVFAADSAEWIRAYYRGVQDAKGAIRYLVNRYQQYAIDTANIFLAGESAGGFVAMGAALLDTPAERPAQTFALNNVPIPSTNAANCSYAPTVAFSNPVSRPDLGAIEGTIEPICFDYTIKAVGNMYGGMLSNLLPAQNPLKPKPAIYMFHQPCDLVVPIDSGRVYEGLSWCMTNGYGCSAIANTPEVYGSRAIANWNTNNVLGYNFLSEFTNVNFPFNYLFGQGSCVDQVNNPCHAYDSKAVREQNMANFFAGMVTTPHLCDSLMAMQEMEVLYDVAVYPNPVAGELTVRFLQQPYLTYTLYDMLGAAQRSADISSSIEVIIPVQNLARGTYILSLMALDGTIHRVKVIKQ